MLSARKYDNVVALNLDDTIPDYLSFAFPQDSELVDVFNHFFLKLRQTGVLQRISERWAPKTLYNAQQDALESGTVLGFENLSFPFVGLATGIISAAVISLIEQITRRSRPKREDSRALSNQKLAPRDKIVFPM